MKTRARNGVKKGDSSKETRLCEAAGVHHTGLGTPNGSSVYLMDVAYAATREPLENRLA
jgi:hypothetical protein